MKLRTAVGSDDRRSCIISEANRPSRSSLFYRFDGDACSESLLSGTDPGHGARIQLWASKLEGPNT